MRYQTTITGVALALTLGAFGATADAQMAPADHATTEKALMANEMKVSEAFTKKDVATMKMFIADEAVGCDASGCNSIGDMYKQLPTMDMKVTSQSCTNFVYHWVDANSVVLTYTWTGKGTMMGQPIQSPVYASTLWTKRGAKWQAVFHQETVAAPMPPAAKIAPAMGATPAKK